MELVKPEVLRLLEEKEIQCKIMGNLFFNKVYLNLNLF